METIETKVKGCFRCAFGAWPRSAACIQDCDNHGPDKYPAVHGPNASVLCPACGSTETGWGRTSDQAFCLECGRSHQCDLVRDQYV